MVQPAMFAKPTMHHDWMQQLVCRVDNLGNPARLVLTFLMPHDLSIVEESPNKLSYVIDAKNIWYQPPIASRAKKTRNPLINCTVANTVQDVIEVFAVGERLHRLPVQNIIVNNVVSLWDRWGQAVADENGAHVVSGFWNDNIPFVITNGQYKNYTDYENSKVKFTVERFVESWAITTANRVTAGLVIKEKELDALQSKMMSLTADIGELRRVDKLIRTTSQQAFAQTLKEIQQIPNVASVSFAPDMFVVDTGDCWFTTSAGHKKYLGRYRVYFGIGSVFCAYQNLVTPNEVVHPHVSLDTMCKGDYPAMVSSALMAADYSLAVSVIIAMLQDTTETDWGASRRLVKLTDKIPDTKMWTKSKLITVYGSPALATIELFNTEVQTQNENNNYIHGNPFEVETNVKKTKVASIPEDDEDEDDSDEDDEDDDDDDDD